MSTCNIFYLLTTTSYCLFSEVDGPLIGGVVAPADATVHVTSLVVANPDGKVRESHDKRVLTRNITERVQETEEKIHNGDTTHEVSFILWFVPGIFYALTFIYL